MKRILLALTVIALLTSCKKDKTEQSGGDEINLLASRLPGDWTLVAVEYSGLAPMPDDSTQHFPFSGDGENVSGYFKFTKDPNLLDFQMVWTAKVGFGPGMSFTIPVNEEGEATWEVNEKDRTIEGVAWGMNGANDTIPAVWHVEKNEPTRQVWTTSRSFNWDGFDIPVIVDIKSTFTK